MRTKVVKKILELDEKRFLELGDYIEDYKKLKKEKGFSKKNFQMFVEIYLNKVNSIKDFAYKIMYMPLPFGKRKKQKNFVEKYRFLLEYFNDMKMWGNLEFCEFELYDYLKENYSQKDHFLKVLEKLIELKIYYFEFYPYDYLSRPFDKDQEIRIEDSEFRVRVDAFTTDGKITWKDYDRNSIAKTAKASIEDANYILTYHKQIVFNAFGSSVPYHDMQIKSLSLDIDTLPTSQLLYNLRLIPQLDYEELEKILDAKNKKNARISEVYSINNLAETTQHLIFELESLTQRLDIAKDKKEVQDILDKIKYIRELYDDIKLLEEKVVEETEEDLMSKEELQKGVEEKRLHYTVDYC